MSTPQLDRASVRPLRPVLVFGVLALAFALRMLHLSSALQSPLSYQPGPDEDYYLRFGSAVAAGQGADAAEFTFMDPAFGYLLGAVFKLCGVNVFAVYLLQTLLDTATAFGILEAGRMLERPRAGLYGALLYALTSTAIMFCAALVKEVWVASYVTWWVVGALAVHRSERKLPWLAFGGLCGLGVALRSTMLLLGLFAVLLPVVGGRRTDWMAKAALLVVGMAISLVPWSVRNHQAFGGISPLPHNGGIVLHQAYNEQNPAAAIWIPDFVNYLHPSEIWRGYAAEAERRVGRNLSAPEVDDYWRGEALRYIGDHPGEVLAHVARKGLEFLSATEVPNNRSAAEERMFSAVLRILPPPPIWLLAMGIAGLGWFALSDSRWLIVAAPIAVSWVTFAVFWAEDRFRFHAVPLLALCSGLWIDSMLRELRDFRKSSQPVAPAAFGFMAALLAALALYLGTSYPSPPIRWDHIVWGYIKMGKPAEARALAERISIEQPDNAPLFEALGFLAASERRYDEAERDYRRAIELRPRSYLAHYNLAKVYLVRGDKPNALREARISLQLSSSADTAALLQQIEDAP